VDDKGVPFFKDIPIIGRAFRNEGISEDNTELVILITAYVLRGQADKAQFVRRLSGDVDRLMADDSRLLTLQPRNF
jgi:general secretion pathway protein D